MPNLISPIPHADGWIHNGTRILNCKDVISFTGKLSWASDQWNDSRRCSTCAWLPPSPPWSFRCTRSSSTRAFSTNEDPVGPKPTPGRQRRNRATTARHTRKRDHPTTPQPDSYPKSKRRPRGSGSHPPASRPGWKQGSARYRCCVSSAPPTPGDAWRRRIRGQCVSLRAGRRQSVGEKSRVINLLFSVVIGAYCLHVFAAQWGVVCELNGLWWSLLGA